MRLTAAVIGILSLVQSQVGARPTWNENGLKRLEKLREVPPGWTQGAAPAPSKLLKFRLAVRQERAAEFEQMVIDMSTPSHPNYGNHMKRHEVKEFLRPSAEVSHAILSWLEAEQVPSDNVEDDGDWINFIVPVSQAEKMMSTTFYNYHHSSGISRIRTLEYSIPESLHDYVQMIQPTTRFGQYRPQRTAIKDVFDMPLANGTGFDPVFCNTTITPDCIRGLYQIGDFRANPNVGNRLGISGYLNQFAQFNEFNQFTNTYAPYANGFNFSVVSINGGLNTQLPPSNRTSTAEANLDVQYAISLSFNTPTTYYTTGGLGELVPDLDQPTQADNQNEPYLEQLNYLLDLDDDELPFVLSTSYGEDEQSVPAEYSNATCSLFAQLGARGVSVIFSSGDTGVGSACQTNDGQNTTRFNPIFPAACPFVTSVGGTVGVQPERAVSFSSGGFSDRFPRPAYQDAAVSEYLAGLGDTFAGLYNPEGRGFPDIAAQGVNFAVFDKGVSRGVSGTSASAPTIAGIIADLNSVRLEAGKRPLGFLNPFLYETASSAFTDIVNGGSTGCDGVDNFSGLPTPVVPGASWKAVPGWDPVTGFGTPIFPTLLDFASAAP